MAQSALKTGAILAPSLPRTAINSLPAQASPQEMNITSLSQFKAWLVAMGLAALLWASIVYILAR